ncbi:MAG TPA: hypothetical protein DF383_13195, partial [Deltaproteobacteria bacterium]|nr:hypothetical protein [Deltaproteobacteria bacterium]
ALMANWGLCLPVEINIPQALAAFFIKQKLPPTLPQSGIFLIDSGASATAVDDKLLRSLGLQPVNQVSVKTPSGETNQFVYIARIEFPGTSLPVLERTVVGCNLSDQEYCGLLGRDILQYCVLNLNGPDGSFSLSY